MDYWKIKEKNYTVILFEYYMACFREKADFGNFFVKSGDIKNAIKNWGDVTGGYLFFDMKGVEKAASRIFVFLQEQKILDRIVFFNVREGSEIYDCLDTDLHGKVGGEKSARFIYFSDETKEQFLKSDIKETQERQKIDILKKYVNKEITFLPSSGIYSNMSLDYKKVFEAQKDFWFIIYELYNEIHCIEEKQKFDFLVAASKNAIALTAILGSLLRKRAIYHTNIGQKYVKQKFTDKVENKIDAVQKAKKYLMIFDVICLGTEARILNGIINALGGHLIGAVGIVCVQDPEAICLFDRDSILAKAKCLATAAEMGLGYRIALTREELEGEGNEC